MEAFMQLWYWAQSPLPCTVSVNESVLENDDICLFSLYIDVYLLYSMCCANPLNGLIPLSKNVFKDDINTWKISGIYYSSMGKSFGPI